MLVRIGGRVTYLRAPHLSFFLAFLVIPDIFQQFLNVGLSLICRSLRTRDGSTAEFSAEFMSNLLIDFP